MKRLVQEAPGARHVVVQREGSRAGLRFARSSQLSTGDAVCETEYKVECVEISQEKHRMLRKHKAERDAVQLGSTCQERLLEETVLEPGREDLVVS